MNNFWANQNICSNSTDSNNVNDNEDNNNGAAY